MLLFTRVYVHAQTAVDAGVILTWRITIILITGKIRILSIGAHAGKTMVLTSCIQGLNLWLYVTIITGAVSRAYRIDSYGRYNSRWADNIFWGHLKGTYAIMECFSGPIPREKLPGLCNSIPRINSFFVYMEIY